MDKTIIDDALEFVRNTFNDDYSGHDYFHTFRVHKMAARIAEIKRNEGHADKYDDQITFEFSV